MAMQSRGVTYLKGVATKYTIVLTVGYNYRIAFGLTCHLEET